MCNSGVYRIICIPTNRAYVGATVDLENRKIVHFRDLVLNKHFNPKLQRAYNLHGRDSFKFEVLEHVPDAEELGAKEIEHLQNTPLLFNSHKRQRQFKPDRSFEPNYHFVRIEMTKKEYKAIQDLLEEDSSLMNMKNYIHQLIKADLKKRQLI